MTGHMENYRMWLWLARCLAVAAIAGHSLTAFAFCAACYGVASYLEAKGDSR